MKNIVAITLAVTLLGGCMTPMPTRGAFVPYQTVLAETEGLPYECGSYDPASDSCESLGTSRLSGNTVVGEADIVLSAQPPVTLSVRARATVRDGRVCVDPDNYVFDINGLPDRQSEEFFAGMVEAEMGGIGTICASYFRTDRPGVYITETRDASGALLPDGIEVSTFLADRKRLRVVSF